MSDPLPDNPRPIVRVDRVNHYYGEGVIKNQVLYENCLEVGAGQLVVVTGPSGSGKTTLLSLIGALRSVQEGEIHVLDRNLTGLAHPDLVAMRRNIGFIFQSHNLFESLSAYENVKMAMQLGDHPFDEMRTRGVAILERLGLADRVNYKPRELSGGQRQRVAVARALVNRPKLILADEPTAALEKETSIAVVRLLKELTVKNGCTIMMVTHDNRILDLADRVVNIVDGRIISDIMLSDIVLICELLRNVDLFRHLTPAEITNTAEKMERRSFAKGDTIIHEGGVGDLFFLLSRGSVYVFRRIDGAGQRLLQTLTAGQYFGERALIDNAPRNATCIAATDVEVFALGISAFRQALERSPSFRDQIQGVYFQRTDPALGAWT
jgi:putative ABC transport system ATP-binding protein